MLTIKNNVVNFISKQNKDIIIIPGKHNFYDSLISSLSVSLISKYLNKAPVIITNEKIPYDLSFLPFESIITLSSFSQKETSLNISSNSQTIKNLQYSITKRSVNITLKNNEGETIHNKDLVILPAKKIRYGVVAVGCSEQELENIKNDKTIKNSSVLSLSDLHEHSSICETITQNLKIVTPKIHPLLATTLATGIITKNKNFKNTTTPQSLKALSYLSSNKADIKIINRNILENTTFSFIKLFSILLKRVEYIEKHKMAYTYIEEGLDVSKIKTKHIHQAIRELRAMFPFANMIIIGIQTHKTLICITSIINGDSKKIKSELKITTKGSSFALPIKKTQSTKNELIQLGSFLTNSIK